MLFVKHPARHHQTIFLLLRHLGPLGLFLLAIFDSLPFPTFGALDIFTAVLAARQRHLWYYLAALATAGSVVGACITFRMARRAELQFLHRRFGEKRIAKLKRQFERWGTGALAVCTGVPFPLPTSACFAVAGALNYPLKTFVVVVALCRVLRYSAIALIAGLYGRRFIISLRHLWEHSALIVVLFIAAAVAIILAVVLVKRHRSARPADNVRAA
jgi:membrane protein YqaA with SNARE-associated domain